MPRLRYLKTKIPYTDEIVYTRLLGPAQDEEDAFRTWRDWRHRHEDTPLPDFVAPEDARAYRQYLRDHDTTRPPPGPLGVPSS